MSVNVQLPPSGTANEIVRRLLMEVLLRKLGEAGAAADGIDETTALIELGVIDSQGLLDIILEVEDGCGRMFDPMLIDLEGEVTLHSIAAAFEET